MEDDEFKKCPFCKEKIRVAAIKCRFCGEWLEQPPAPAPSQAVTQEPQKTENLTDDEIATEQKSLSQEDFDLGEKVFRELADSLNIYPAEEAWQTEFLARKNSDTKISPQLLEDLWIASDASGRKPLQKTIEKKNEPSGHKIFDVQPRKLYLVGTGFLLAGIGVVIWMFRDVDFSRGDPDKVTTLLAAMILKPILGSIALAWTVHGFFGKRKGYMFLVFAITWTLIMAWCAIKFREGFNESRAKSKVENEHMATFASNVLEYAQNPQSTSLEKITTAANDNNNPVLIPVMEFSKQLVGAVEKRDQSLAALQERDIYDLSLLTNKSDMELEMQKRLSGQVIIETFKTNVNEIIENTRQRYYQIVAPENDKLKSLKGFEESIKNQEPGRENSYRLLIAQQEGEYDYLQFLCDSFNDYQIKDGKILFSTDEALAGYNAKLKIIDDTEKEMAELRQSMLNSSKNSAQQLLKQ